MVMSRSLPLSEVKAKLSEIVDQVATTHERVVVTRNGRPIVVLLSVEDLDTIDETIALLSDPAAMDQIKAGRDAIATGDVAGRHEIDRMLERLRTETA